MTTDQQTTKRAPGTPGAFSRWMQRTMNARTGRKIRGGNGEFMGMDVLILNTIGKRTGQPRENPLAFFPDGADAWLVVASGGGSQNPGWHANLFASPDQVTVEFADGAAFSVTPSQLDDEERGHAWQRIAREQPGIAKYQSKSERVYPVIRLTRRTD